MATRFISHSLNNLLAVSVPLFLLFNRIEYFRKPDRGYWMFTTFSSTLFPMGNLSAKITSTFALLVTAILPMYYSAPSRINSLLLFYLCILQCWNEFFNYVQTEQERQPQLFDSSICHLIWHEHFLKSYIQYLRTLKSCAYKMVVKKWLFSTWKQNKKKA